MSRMDDFGIKQLIINPVHKLVRLQSFRTIVDLLSLLKQQRVTDLGTVEQ